jgi:2-polyprenyl-3-methyl-5-hydroxy-6-metoxy-1,4-benzoquinol methylase
MNQYQCAHFAYDEALKLVEKQIEHFNTLNLNLENKNVLEVGCGPLGKYTQFLIDKGAIVTSSDIREEHLQSLKKNVPLVKDTFVGDMNTECITDTYDAIFSIGNLYHLNKPSEAIKHMSEKCTDFLFISTAVNNGRTEIDFVPESTDDTAQAFNGIGCRPSREWVYNELKKYFKYVFIPRTQPDYMDFVIDWTPETVYHHAKRFIIVGTNKRDSFSDELWSEELLTRQTRC